MRVTSTVRLSSVGVIPLTPDTRAVLLAAGVQPESLEGLSEGGGQSILAMRSHFDGETFAPPSCFQKRYDPVSRLCGGCVFQPRCWRGDGRYLAAVEAGTSSPPPGVPPLAVEARTDALAARAAVPAPARPPVRPPARPTAPPAGPPPRRPPPAR